MAEALSTRYNTINGNQMLIKQALYNNILLHLIGYIFKEKNIVVIEGLVDMSETP